MPGSGCGIQRLLRHGPGVGFGTGFGELSPRSAAEEGRPVGPGAGLGAEAGDLVLGLPESLVEMRPPGTGWLGRSWLMLCLVYPVQDGRNRVQVHPQSQVGVESPPRIGPQVQQGCQPDQWTTVSGREPLSHWLGVNQGIPLARLVELPAGVQKV